jgi:hypothetical protein
MVEKIKKRLPYIVKNMLIILGGLALFKWVVIPGISISNLFLNLLSLLLGMLIILIVGVGLLMNVRFNMDFELTEEEQEKILQNLRERGTFQEEENKEDNIEIKTK